jgi:hypothetical protein
VGVYWLCALVVMLAIEANIFYGTSDTQKPLSTVSGTIHAGVLTTIVFYLLMEIIL